MGVSPAALGFPTARGGWSPLVRSHRDSGIDATSSGKLLVVLVAKAGWHVAKRQEVLPNEVLHRLPWCMTELHPIEPLGPLLREAAANGAASICARKIAAHRMMRLADGQPC